MIPDVDGPDVEAAPLLQRAANNPRTYGCRSDGNERLSGEAGVAEPCMARLNTKPLTQLLP